MGEGARTAALREYLAKVGGVGVKKLLIGGGVLGLGSYAAAKGAKKSIDKQVTSPLPQQSYV
jgi:hypothetical protein